jgi:hypothetical protein
MVRRMAQRSQQALVARRQAVVVVVLAAHRDPFTASGARYAPMQVRSLAIA